MVRASGLSFLPPTATDRATAPAAIHSDSHLRPRPFRRFFVALWLPALFTAGLGWCPPALLRAEGELAARVDPWPGNGAGSALLLSIPGVPTLPTADARALVLEIEAAGGSATFALPGGVPAELEVDAGALPVDPWGIPAAGERFRYRLLSAAGIAAEGEACLRSLTARESLDRLEAAARGSSSAPERGRALALAARAALDLGQPALAEPALAEIRDLLSGASAGEIGGAARAALSLERSLLEARLERSFGDADERHRAAADERLERSARDPAVPPELAAERAILLAEAILERLPAMASEGERRALLDLLRQRAREARESAVGTVLAPEAELLWARLAIERGWRTEARDTLLALDSADPRRAARVAELRARLAAVERDPGVRGRELDRAAAELARVRARLGDPELDGGYIQMHGEILRARIGAAAARDDALGTLAAIEDARPRARAPRGRDSSESGAPCTVETALALIPEGTTLLVLAEGDGSLVTVRAGKDRSGAVDLVVHASPVPPGETARRVATLLRSRGEDLVAAAWLAERLLLPHEGALAPRLLLAPLGALRPVPFDALPLGGRYLCETCEVSTIPDLASLARAAPAGDGPWLALIDPATDYDGDGAPDRPGLPSTRAETESWAALGGGAILRQGADAQEASLRAEGARAGVLHLGCHGEHERRRPMRSRLLLAPGGGEDGRISAAELAELDLGGTALVCLAGCETGLTRALGGDDLAGFPRAVLESGAAAFLGSLWPVEDATAGEFLRAFHGRYRESRDAGAALRSARLEAIAEPARRSPRHWAPWVLLQNAGKAAEDGR